MLFKIVNELVVVPSGTAKNSWKSLLKSCHYMRAITLTLWNTRFFHELYGTGIAFRKTLSLHQI